MDMVESVALKQRKVPFRSFHAGYPCTHLTIHRLHFIYDTFYEQSFQMFQLHGHVKEDEKVDETT